MPSLSVFAFAFCLLWASSSLADSKSILSQMESLRTEITNANKQHAMEMDALRAEIAVLNELNEIEVFERNS